jgi:DNA polymerase-3 subunit gamma/tau
LKSLDDGSARPATMPAQRASAPAGGGNGVSAVTEPRVIERNGGGQTMRLVEAEPVQAPALPREEPQPAVEAVPVTSLADIAALADANRDMAFKVLVKRCVRLVRVEPGRLDVSLIGDAPKTLLGDLTVKLKAWTGRNWMVSLSREEGGATLAELEASKRETAISDAKSDPAVASILARFPGARVIDVRIPNAPEADVGDDGPAPDPAAEDDDLN